MDDRRYEDMKFKWERQKFLLSLWFATMITTMGFVFFWLQQHDRDRIPAAVQEAVKETISRSEAIRLDARDFERRLQSLEEQVNNQQTLLKTLEENQKAQTRLIESLTKAPKQP